VQSLLFARPELTHSINSAKKKMTFERRFRLCERVAHLVEMACRLLHHHQSKDKFAPPSPIKKQVCFGMLAELLL
jgi:hypothetical protein